MKQPFSILVLFAFLLLAGCQSDDSGLDDTSAAVEPEVLGPVSVLLVDTPGVADEIKRQWLAGHDGKLSVVEVSLEGFTRNNFDVIAAHDAIIYPGSLIGDLVAADKILSVPKAVWESSDVNKKGLLQISRTRLVSYGKEKWALPLGSPQFCLMYRADVLNALNAEPPKTWSEFFALAETLRNLESLKDEAGNELPRDVDIPVAKGWAAHSLLAVAASRARNRGKLSTVFERDTANPLINTSPFVDALNEMKGVYGSDANYLAPNKISQRMFGGQSAMGIGWPSIAFVESGKEVEPNDQVQIMALPGSTRWFDFESGTWKDREEDLSINVDLVGFSGRLISVLRSTEDPNKSFEFASWLSSQSISLVTMSRSDASAPFRASHLGDIYRWTGPTMGQKTGNTYADLIAESNARSIYFMFPRIPGYVEYISALDQAVGDCLHKQSNAQTELDIVSQSWQVITEQHGRAKQKRALRLNEGI